MANTSGVMDKYGAYLEGYSPGAGQGGQTPGNTNSVWDSWLRHFEAPPAHEFKVQPQDEHAYMTSPYYQQRQKQIRGQRTDRTKLRKLAKEAGVDVDNPTELAQAWMRAVEEAKAASAVGGNVSPWDILERWSKGGAPGTLKERATKEQQERDFWENGEGAQFDPYSITRTNRAIRVTDPDTAKALVTRVLRQELGRKPNDNEIADFVSALNKKERSSPTVTTTVENYGADNQLRGSETTTTDGAPDPGAFAQTFVDDQFSEEGTAYRAGTEYHAVMEALVGTIA